MQRHSYVKLNDVPNSVTKLGQIRPISYALKVLKHFLDSTKSL
jgi:hypothetical protein